LKSWKEASLHGSTTLAPVGKQPPNRIIVFILSGLAIDFVCAYAIGQIPRTSPPNLLVLVPIIGLIVGTGLIFFGAALKFLWIYRRAKQDWKEYKESKSK
jgi:hypothetical protein